MNYKKLYLTLYENKLKYPQTVSFSVVIIQKGCFRVHLTPALLMSIIRNHNSDLFTTVIFTLFYSYLYKYKILGIIAKTSTDAERSLRNLNQNWGLNFSTNKSKGILKILLRITASFSTILLGPRQWETVACLGVKLSVKMVELNTETRLM